MTGRATRRVLAAAMMFGVPAGAVHPDDRSDSGPLVVEVRVFEIRRLNSDFSPVEDLSFLVDTDGTSVQVSEWLATLARRVPDAYFAQLLTLGPTAAESEAQWQITRRDARRAIRLRMGFARPEPPAPESGESKRRFRLDFDLLRMGTTAQRIRVEGPVETDMTRMVSGRDFELPLSRYLSWFRDPSDLEARGELYEKIRDRNIYLALGITFRRAEAPELPVRLRPPPDPQLAELRSPLLGKAEGILRLRVHLDEVGVVNHTEVLETTLPEVTPRVLGIVFGWQFPQAAGRQGRLFFPVRTVVPVPSN
ncbi:MAG: hypothetical protein OXI45_04720 [Acidobacteriota bacterium]|nr:hypothetical protein [Acidobacteriota bacterium]